MTTSAQSEVYRLLNHSLGGLVMARDIVDNNPGFSVHQRYAIEKLVAACHQAIESLDKPIREKYLAERRKK